MGVLFMSLIVYSRKIKINFNVSVISSVSGQKGGKRKKVGHSSHDPRDYNLT